MPATLTEINPREVMGSLLFRVTVSGDRPVHEPATLREMGFSAEQSELLRVHPHDPHCARSSDFQAIDEWLRGFGLEHITALALFRRDGGGSRQRADELGIEMDRHHLLAVTQQVRDEYGPVQDFASNQVSTVYRVLDLGPELDVPEWAEKYTPENYSWL